MPQRLLVRGATVYNGTAAPPIAADVLVEGDRIAAVGSMPGGVDADLLDADGMAVAPGFINVLSHAYFTIQQDPRGLSDLMQGVTTLVFGEGVSLGPGGDELRELLEGWVPAPAELRRPWDRLSEFLAHLQRRGVTQNVASFVGAHNLRILGAGFADRRMTATELDRVRGVLAEELTDGALGLASALIYPPGCYADTHELLALCRVVAEHDGLYISHLRGEGDRLLEAIAELLYLGREAGVRAEVYHLKAAGRENWPKMNQAIELIESARAAGQPVTADMYPYTAGATFLSASIPPSAHEGGMEALRARLADQRQRAQIAAAIRQPSPDWENIYLAAGGAGGVRLLGDTANEPAGLLGRTLAEAADLTGEDPVELLLDLAARHPGLVAAYFIIDEDNLRTVLRQPWVAIGSDAEALAAEPPFDSRPTHPRGYGTFARVLGRYVRDEGLLPLAEAVRRMTSLPADTLRLTDRGRIAAGCYADLVVFDPATIADRATYLDPHRYAVGIRHVVVNGEVVVRDGTPTGALPGRALRRGT